MGVFPASTQTRSGKSDGAVVSQRLHAVLACQIDAASPCLLHLELVHPDVHLRSCLANTAENLFARGSVDDYGDEAVLGGLLDLVVQAKKERDRVPYGRGGRAHSYLTSIT